MNVSVIGAGALGTFYSAMLASSGQDVTLVCRERDVEMLKKGIHVSGTLDRVAYPAVSTTVPPSGMVLVTVKSYDVASAVKGIRLKPGADAAIIHNGLGPDEEAAAILGKGHVAVGVS